MKLQPRKTPRYTHDHSLYFLTFCTFNRLPILHSSRIPEFLIEELYFYERKIQELVAYTIMPDHVHLMVEVETVSSLSRFLRDFKKYTSAVILKSSRQSSDCRAELLPERRFDNRLLHADRVWQPGTMDHCIRTSWENKDFENHLSYIFFNSYKHLGIKPKDFPYHNFMEFVQKGVFDESFCAVDEETTKGYEIYE